MSNKFNKVSLAGILIAFGIIYGDIGTSPLYVMNAICNGKVINELLVIGGLSCVIWTLTLQTTIKYVLLTLKADNRGEGGIFSLFALVRRHGKWTVFPAMIGGAALLADGMITPPISVTSAIEGLRNIPGLEGVHQTTIIIIVLAIIGVLFFFQQFGTASIGKAFGPIMLVWFMMLAVLGVNSIHLHWAVLKAFNPYYAFELLTVYPKGFWILGAVFLCTTGAEALYSDLGHCGRANIRYSWIFVKSCLILNYLGQGAWMLSQSNGMQWKSADQNPFYGVMPEWFVLIGIAIATIAAIIASQALISGSFTLISEAIKLNLWPKMKINYPTAERGQSFIPGINLLLFLGCTAIVLIFQQSSRMEAAYGLSITLCMIMTSLLFAYYMFTRRVAIVWIALYLWIYLSIELAFLYANLVEKFEEGGVVTLIVGGGLFMTMLIWFKSRKIKNRYVEFVRLEDYITIIQELSNDRSIPKYATHLVYLTSANNPKEIEHKIIYSILYRKPKRADIYWFVHVDVLDDPYTQEYAVQTIIPNEIIRIEFRLGFRVEHRIQYMFRKVVEEMVQNKEVNVVSRYESLSRNNVMGDFRFIVMEKFLSRDNTLPLWDRFMMRGYFLLKKYSLSEERGFGLDPSDVTLEKYPIYVSTSAECFLKRVEQE